MLFVACIVSFYVLWVCWVFFLCLCWLVDKSLPFPCSLQANTLLLCLLFKNTPIELQNHPSIGNMSSFLLVILISQIEWQFAHLLILVTIYKWMSYSYSTRLILKPRPPPQTKKILHPWAPFYTYYITWASSFPLLYHDVMSWLLTQACE